MAVPINPYIAPPLVHIMESFKAAVNEMDETSPSNSPAMTTSPKSDSHQLGQLVAHPDNPKEAALKDVHQETVDFTDDDPPLPCQPLMEEFFQMDCQSHVFWANLCLPLPPNPADPFEALFHCLVKFVVAMTDKDNHFAVSPTI